MATPMKKFKKILRQEICRTLLTQCDVGPSRYFTGTKEGRRELVRFLGRHWCARRSSKRILREKKEKELDGAYEPKRIL